jgi:hypothetical protein
MQNFVPLRRWITNAVYWPRKAPMSISDCSSFPAVILVWLGANSSNQKRFCSLDMKIGDVTCLFVTKIFTSSQWYDFLRTERRSEYVRSEWRSVRQSQIIIWMPFRQLLKRGTIMTLSPNKLCRTQYVISSYSVSQTESGEPTFTWFNLKSIRARTRMRTKSRQRPFTGFPNLRLFGQIEWNWRLHVASCGSSSYFCFVVDSHSEIGCSVQHCSAVDDIVESVCVYLKRCDRWIESFRVR